MNMCWPIFVRSFVDVCANAAIVERKRQIAAKVRRMSSDFLHHLSVLDPLLIGSLNSLSRDALTFGIEFKWKVSVVEEQLKACKLI